MQPNNTAPQVEVNTMPDVGPIPWGFLETVSPWALLALTIIFLLFGRIIPVRTHDREIEAKDEVIRDLRETVKTERETNDVLTQTNRTLAHDLAAPIAKIMSALQEKAEGAGDRH